MFNCPWVLTQDTIVYMVIIHSSNADNCQKLVQDPEFEQTLSTVYELYIALMKALSTREVTLTNLNKLKKDIEENHNSFQKIKLGGKVITAAGSVLSLAGFGSSFFTFGASLGLTGVGSVLYGVGGVTCAIADIGNLAMTQQNLKNAQMILDTDREMMESAKKLDDKLANLISSLEHKYPTIPSSDIKKLIRLYATPLMSGLYNVHDINIGRATFSLIKSGSKTGSHTVWSGLSFWDKGLSVTYAALDVIYLVKDVQEINSLTWEIRNYEKLGKSSSEAAQKIEEIVAELEQNRNDLIESLSSEI